MSIEKREKELFRLVSVLETKVEESKELLKETEDTLALIKAEISKLGNGSSLTKLAGDVKVDMTKTDLPDFFDVMEDLVNVQRSNIVIFFGKIPKNYDHFNYAGGQQAYEVKESSYSDFLTDLSKHKNSPTRYNYDGLSVVVPQGQVATLHRALSSSEFRNILRFGNTPIFLAYNPYSNTFSHMNKVAY